MTFAWKFGLAALLAAGLIGGMNPAWGQDEAATPAAEEAPASEAQEFAPESVQAGIQEMLQYARTGGEDTDPIPKRYAKCVEMIDKMWEMDRTLPETKQLLALKIQLSTILARLGNKEAATELDDFLAKLTKDADPEIAQEAQNAILSLKLSRLASMSAEERQATIDEVKGRIIEAEPSVATVQMARMLASSLSTSLEPEAAAKEVTQLAEHFKDSGDETVEKAAASLFGLARRLNLPGKEIELTGTLLNGEDLDFASAYKGKVVVVDFWATWCGPCIAEFPNMKKLYEKYHPHGFEIVGISLDDKKEPVEEFVEKQDIPWTIVWTDKGDSVRGWEDPNAVRYGINAIPTMIFVGKDGKVESLNARGQNLDQLLAEAFPDVKADEEKAPEKEEGTE